MGDALVSLRRAGGPRDEAGEEGGAVRGVGHVGPVAAVVRREPLREERLPDHQAGRGAGRAHAT
eukprot:9786988-Alexandrium_andersonii.AAC.1